MSLFPQPAQRPTQQRKHPQMEDIFAALEDTLPRPWRSSETYLSLSSERVKIATGRLAKSLPVHAFYALGE